MKTALSQLYADVHARFDLAPGLREKPEIKRIATGITTVDRLTDGGIPRASFTEISGGVSTGRMALLIAAVGNATRQGECCVWIDGGGGLDPASAEKAGVDLTRLLWVNCNGNAEHALKAADLLVQAGGFGFIILDLAEMPDASVRRIALASWFRLRHAAEKSGAALVAVESKPYARSCSNLQIEMSQQRTVSSILCRGRLWLGLTVQAECRKQYRAESCVFEAVP